MIKHIKWLSIPVFGAFFFWPGYIIPQSSDAGRKEPPMLDPARIEAQKKSWSFLVPLPKTEKSTVLIAAKGRQIELQVIIRNNNFIYDIWDKDDSTVEVKISYCPPKDCDDMPLKQNIVLPRVFNLFVLYNDDTAQVRVAFISNKLAITEIRSRNFVEFQGIRDWSSPIWCFSWQGGVEIETLKKIHECLDSLGNVEVIESGWYQGLPNPVEKVMRFVDRKTPVSYNCVQDNREYILVFFRPDRENQMRSILAAMKSR
jgi:hypothetical protein